MPRQEFPTSVRVAAMKRCCDEKGVPRCEGCGIALKAGKHAYDHVIADGLGGKPTLDNCMVLCTGPDSCHDRKTREHDVPLIAKAKRLEAARLGAATPTSRPLQGRGFTPAPPQRRATKPLTKWAAWRNA